MCRSIKQLREGNEIATPEEIEAAALQFVRKVSGYRAPSKKNTDAYDLAVREISDSAARMLESITVRTAV
ncbi:hypothetical protein BH18ACT6_BH18ACT6_24110 [soil metagenome]